MLVKVNNEDFDLLPQKAFFWRRESILGFSDVHLGKAESYQATGIPMPSGAHKDDFHAIENLIETHQPKRILILGDWIHQKSSWSESLQSDLHDFFLRHQDRHWTLIVGNHEKGSMEYLRKFPIEIILDDLQIGSIRFAHGHAVPSPKEFVVMGHIHPAVRLSEGSTSVKLPAFVLKKHSLILPAFGSQTGGYQLKISTKDRVFPTTGNSIFELTPSSH